MNAVARSFGIVLALGALMISGCHTTPKKKPPPKKEATPKPTPKMAESEDADFDAFIARLRKAAAAHDMNTIAGTMIEGFGYSLNPERTGEGVFKYWDENNLWPELEGILSEKFVKKDQFMVAPPQFADPSLNYTGYRAGVARVKGSWKFVYFVNSQ